MSAGAAAAGGACGRRKGIATPTRGRGPCLAGSRQRCVRNSAAAGESALRSRERFRELIAFRSTCGEFQQVIGRSLAVPGHAASSWDRLSSHAAGRATVQELAQGGAQSARSPRQVRPRACSRVRRSRLTRPPKHSQHYRDRIRTLFRHEPEPESSLQAVRRVKRAQKVRSLSRPLPTCVVPRSTELLPLFFSSCDIYRPPMTVTCML